MDQVSFKHYWINRLEECCIDRLSRQDLSGLGIRRAETTLNFKLFKKTCDTMRLSRSQMTLSTPILACVSYPLIYNLPFNPVTFLWGFHQGLAPMPPEVKERAESAERVVHFGKYVIVLMVVVLLVNGSSLSIAALGFTANNWKSAIALGVVISFIPQGIIAILLRRIPRRDKLRKDSDSHGPLVTWCGLKVLGSFSTEFWRAFCITALMSLDISAWIAVLIVAVVGGATYLSTSTGRAAGTAVFGILAGLVFIKTGSLQAPLTMSLIGAGAELYRSRHVHSGT
jgi:hypothetical protein